MKLLTIDSNGKLEIIPELLGISPFSEIWSLDKTKTKEEAYKNCKYIWFFADYDSPYFQYSEEDRHKYIITDVIKDAKYKPSKEVEKGIVKYTQLNTTPAMKLLESAYGAIFKMDDYFKNVDFAEDDIDKVTRSIIAMPKMIAAINEAKELCKKEQSSGIKVRGGASTGLYEG
tara:strand:+ start:207 stop:725 length:519 start_codon:yes stop_codon:yes gene_type:complete